MSTKEVITKSSGIFWVSKNRGEYYIYKAEIGFVFDSSYEIGRAGTFEDALSFIKSYTGDRITKIGNR